MASRAPKLIRGMIGMGLVWAGAWGCVGVVIGVLEWLLLGDQGLLAELIEGVGGVMVPGFLFGASLSAVVAVAERKRTFDELSLPRFAAWGAVAGAFMALILGGVGHHSSVWDDMMRVITFGAMGAGSAAATLRVGRGKAPQIGSGEASELPGSAYPWTVQVESRGAPISPGNAREANEPGRVRSERVVLPVAHPARERLMPSEE